jgi:hypothetical protein
MGQTEDANTQMPQVPEEARLEGSTLGSQALEVKKAHGQVTSVLRFTWWRSRWSPFHPTAGTGFLQGGRARPLPSGCRDSPQTASQV